MNIIELIITLIVILIVFGFGFFSGYIWSIMDEHWEFYKKLDKTEKKNGEP